MQLDLFFLLIFGLGQWSRSVREYGNHVLYELVVVQTCHNFIKFRIVYKNMGGVLRLKYNKNSDSIGSPV